MYDEKSTSPGIRGKTLTLCVSALLGFCGLLTGATANAELIVGVDDVSVALQSGPGDGAWTPLFSGVETGGLAADPVTQTLHIADGAEYFTAPLSGPPSSVGFFIGAGGDFLVPVGLAWANGTLYGVTNFSPASGLNPIGIYAIAPDGTMTLELALDSEFNNMGGFAFNPDDGLFYGTNTTGLASGFYSIDVFGSGAVTLVAPYPASEFRITGLAVGNGIAYLVDHDPGEFYAYDLSQGSNGSYTSFAAPWVDSYFSSGAAWLPVRRIVASILPASRSVQVSNSATAFATIVNAGEEAALSCGIAPSTSVTADFTFQTTDPLTNALTGTADTPVDIATGELQTYVFAFTPTAPFPPTEVQLDFNCANTPSAPVITGLNTFLLSASSTPVPDIVALAAADAGRVLIPGATGTGVFAVATVNVGTAGTITASADTGSASLPLSIAICETVPATGVCLAPPAPTVTTTIAAGETPTFGIFVTGGGTIAPDPANNRIFVRFSDAVERGSTSVAVQTQ